MPACFKANYPATRIIIDCTELFIEMPSSFRAQSQTYSSYKSHNTAKGLAGIALLVELWQLLLVYMGDIYPTR